jgi:hypothetical protein
MIGLFRRRAVTSVATEQETSAHARIKPLRTRLEVATGRLLAPRCFQVSYAGSSNHGIDNGICASHQQPRDIQNT